MWQVEEVAWTLFVTDSSLSKWLTKNDLFTNDVWIARITNVPKNKIE